MKLWGGRFKNSSDDLMEAFNSSLEIDKRLYEEDITGSIAHESFRRPTCLTCIAFPPKRRLGI